MNNSYGFNLLNSIFGGEEEVGRAKLTNDHKYNLAFQSYQETFEERRQFYSNPLNRLRFLKAKRINREFERKRVMLEQYEFIHELLINLIYPQKNTREEA